MNNEIAIRALPASGLQRPAPAAPAQDAGGRDLPAARQPLQEQPGAVDAARLSQAVEQLSRYVEQTRRELSFSVDEATGRTVIKVLDPENDEVIRQIPPEEVLALARALAAEEPGKGGLLAVKA